MSTHNYPSLDAAKAEAHRLADAEQVPYLVGRTGRQIAVVSYPDWLRDPGLNWDCIWTIQPEEVQ